MNAFDEDQFANKIHFANNLDCDSESDKSDFDEWYYNNKPPPVYIDECCNVVKIEPFTTVLYKRSVSKIVHRANGTKNSISDGCGNLVQSAKKTKKKKKKAGKAVVASATIVNRLKGSVGNHQLSLQQGKNFDERKLGSKLTEFVGPQKSTSTQRPKKELDQTKTDLSKKVKPLYLSPTEWPTLDENSSKSRANTLNFQPMIRTEENVRELNVRQKGINIMSNRPAQQKKKKNKLILQAVSQSNDSGSRCINAKLENMSSVKNNKLISKFKTKVLQSQDAEPSENLITESQDGEKTRSRSKSKKENIPKQLEANSTEFNLSSLNWPSLNMSDISVNVDQHIITSFSETTKIPTDIVDISREIKVTGRRPEQIIAIYTSFLTNDLVPCSSSNDRTMQKNKPKNIKSRQARSVESINNYRAEDLFLLEDLFLPTFRKIPNNIEGNSIIPLNSFVTGGRDFFLLDKIFLQSSFSIYAKPRLAMSNVFLHFYTGYKNEVEFLM